MEDYEKKYKEALSRAATELETCGADKSLRNMIYAIFPDELKESEDEKIRKALVRFHKSTIDIDGIKGADILAWLEKQGEQKSIEENNGNNRGTSSNSIWSDEDEIEIPFGAKDSELQESIYYIPDGFHAEIDGDKVVIKKGEKSAAWSEEDENYLQSAENACEYQYGKNTSTILWLKSLKDRMKGKEEKK